MLNICNKCSCINDLIFNATKLMCIQFHYGKHSGEIPKYPVYLWLDKLQWYWQGKHIGYDFKCFSAGVANRKGQFIDCVNGIITQFGFGHLFCRMKLLVTHGYIFVGLLYGIICIPLGILLCTDCMNYLEMLT